VSAFRFLVSRLSVSPELRAKLMEVLLYGELISVASDNFGNYVVQVSLSSSYAN